MALTNLEGGGKGKSGTCNPFGAESTNDFPPGLIVSNSTVRSVMHLMDQNQSLEPSMDHCRQESELKQNVSESNHVAVPLLSNGSGRHTHVEEAEKCVVYHEVRIIVMNKTKRTNPGVGSLGCNLFSERG